MNIRDCEQIIELTEDRRVMCPDPGFDIGRGGFWLKTDVATSRRTVALRMHGSSRFTAVLTFGSSFFTQPSADESAAAFALPLASDPAPHGSPAVAPPTGRAGSNRREANDRAAVFEQTGKRITRTNIWKKAATRRERNWSDGSGVIPLATKTANEDSRVFLPEAKLDHACGLERLQFRGGVPQQVSVNFLVVFADARRRLVKADGGV